MKYKEFMNVAKYLIEFKCYPCKRVLTVERLLVPNHVYFIGCAICHQKIMGYLDLTGRVFSTAGMHIWVKRVDKVK